MEPYSDISSRANSNHRFSSRQTRDSRSFNRRDRHSSGRDGPLSSVSVIESAEYMQLRSEPVIDVGPQNSDCYTSSRTHHPFAGSVSPGLGSQFQTVPQNLDLPNEIEMTSRSPSRKHLGMPTPSTVSKSQDSTACARCIRDKHKCVRQDSTLLKQSRKCLRCLTFDYTCESPTPGNVPQKMSATRPMALRSQSARPAPVAEPGRRDTTQHVPVDVRLSRGPDHCTTSATGCIPRLLPSQEGQNPPTSSELDVPTLTDRLLELAIQHSSHHEQPCPLSASLSLRVEALVNQIPASGPITGGYTFGSVASAGDRRKSHAQQPSHQPPESESESDQEDPGDEDNGNPPQDDQDLLEGTRRPTLACPLAKNQQYLLDHPECHRCLTAKLRNMTAVGQHMKRKHYYCATCRHKFSNPEEFSNHVPKDKHCKRCHESFQTTRELGKHRSKKCRKHDKRDERERWCAIWQSFFPEEQPPASYHADDIPTLQDDVQLVGWIKKLRLDCRLYIRLLLQQNDTVGDTATPRGKDILDRALGQPIDGFDTSWTAPSGFQHGTHALAPPINLAATSPASAADSFFSSITSQALSPPDQAFNRPQQGISVPQMPPQYFTQPARGQNPFHLSQPILNVQQTFQDDQTEMYDPLSPQRQSASQPQPGRYGNTLSPHQIFPDDRGMPPGTGQNYSHDRPSMSRHHSTHTHPTTPASIHSQTPRSFASASTSFPPNPYQSNNATAPSQNTSERNTMDTRTYYPRR